VKESSIQTIWRDFVTFVGLLWRADSRLRLEQRALRKDGQYRWFLIRYNPFRNEKNEVIRWYATGTDIDDRVRAEERTRNENLALREQIDRDSMFEDIVGSSRNCVEFFARSPKWRLPIPQF